MFLKIIKKSYRETVEQVHEDHHDEEEEDQEEEVAEGRGEGQVREFWIQRQVRIYNIFCETVLDS